MVKDGLLIMASIIHLWLLVVQPEQDDIIPTETLAQYIAYARANVQPILTDEAVDAVVKCYCGPHLSSSISGVFIPPVSFLPLQRCAINQVARATRSPQRRASLSPSSASARPTRALGSATRWKRSTSPRRGGLWPLFCNDIFLVVVDWFRSLCSKQLQIRQQVRSTLSAVFIVTFFYPRPHRHAAIGNGS